MFIRVVTVVVLLAVVFLLGCGFDELPMGARRTETARRTEAPTERQSKMELAVVDGDRDVVETVEQDMRLGPSTSAGAADSSAPRPDHASASAKEMAGPPLDEYAVEAAREKRIDHLGGTTGADSGDWLPPSGAGGVPDRRQTYAGILTAGSFDDHQRLADYRNFLAMHQHGGNNGIGTGVSIGQRILVQVTNEKGYPVADAKVAATPMIAAYQNRPQQAVTFQQQTVTFQTGTDGRTVLLTDMDFRGRYDSLEIAVYPPDGSTPAFRRIAAAEQICHVVLPNAAVARTQRLDIALVIDTTGSMGDELHYLKTEIDDIAETVHRMFPDVDQRFALVVYRDHGDQYVTRSYDFTDSMSEFRANLASQFASGGGDYPEAMHVALENAGDLSWRRQDTARMLFLVGDAPPHAEHDGRTLAAVNQLRSQGVRVFPVAGSGTQWKAEFIMRAASFLTMGEYLFLTDHSGVGNPHAKPHVPDYAVEHLNRLMVRKIAEQLAGKKLVPQQVIALERGDLSPLTYPQPPLQCGVQPTAFSCVSPSTAGPRWFERLPLQWMLLGLLVAGVFAVDLLRIRLGI